MKTLSAIAAAVLITISLSSFAADKAPANRTSLDFSAGKFVDAITQGNTENLEEILDNSLVSRFARGKEIKSYGKREVLKALKDAGKVEQNCTTDYEVLETGVSQSVVLVSMEYSNFTKMTRLTLTDTPEGWKISRIASWYK